MRIVGKRGFGVVIGGLVFGSMMPAWSAADEAPPLRFTDEQAERGRVHYDLHCVNCHGTGAAGGNGGPPLKGGAFRARWEPQSGEALLVYLHERMPPSNVGALGDAAYAEVLAFLLRVNGATPGSVPLPTDPAELVSMSLARALPTMPARFEHVVPPNEALEVDALTEAAMKARSERMQALAPVSAAMLRDPPPGAWLHWRRTYDQQGFSPLEQIHRENVENLRVAWSWRLQTSSNEITPLVHDGVMFVASGGRVQALDAATGELLWQYFRRGSPGQLRNLAIAGERIFFASSDTHLTALDARSGEVVWERLFSFPKDKLRFTAGPLVAGGVVIQGMSGCHLAYPGGCYLVALDAETGEEVWRFHTLARPGQPGGDTWNDLPVDQRLGGSVWTTGAYDPELDLAYFGVGQTYKITTLLRGGDGSPGSSDGLYTSSTLAIRPETGELVWHYQHLQREVWDLDWAFERTLTTRIIDGRPRRVVTTGGKLGIFDTLDAATGEYIGSYDAGLQNVVASIDEETGRKTIAPDVEPEPDVEKLVCPSSMGHRNWPATAWDPGTGILYVPLSDNCMPYTWTPDVVGDVDFEMLPIHRPGSDGLIGEVRAVDLAEGEVLWSARRRAAQSSAALVTAGGLLFEGSRDRWFRASDSSTGRVLWQIRLDAPPSAYPVTYAVDGVQYVAVTSGGGNSLDANLGSLTPEFPISAPGVTLWVFRLP